MDVEDKKVLRRNAVKFRDNLKFSDIKSNLVAAEIFTDTGLQSIEGGGDRPEFQKVEQLLSDLPRRGPTAYVKFYNCLVNSGHEDLAKLLEDRVPEDKRRRGDAVPIAIQERHKQLEPLSIAADGSIKINLLPVKTVKDDGVYSMTGRTRGLALIVCVQQFEPGCGLPSRAGSATDVENISNLFTALYYEVLEPVINPDDVSMWKALVQFSNDARHGLYESMALVLMSHGTEDNIYAANGRTISIPHITELFDASNCPDLAKRPKLFIIQACRGVRTDQGHEVTDSAILLEESSVGVQRDTEVPAAPPAPPTPQTPQRIMDDKIDARKMMKKIPNPSDMYIAYSTPSGYASWRNQIDGSWFIQDIVISFCYHAHELDIHGLFTKVNERVSARSSSSTGEVQVPAEENRLTKLWYFNPHFVAPTSTHTHNTTAAAGHALPHQVENMKIV